MEDYEGTAEQVSPPEQFAATTDRAAPRRVKTGGGQGRKSHACTECKRLKMRCEPLPGERRCSRCMRRGLECMYDRPYNPAIAMLPGSCETKLDQIGKDICHIQATLENLAKTRSTLISQYEQQPSPGARSGSSKHGPESLLNGTAARHDSDDDDALHSHSTTPRHTAMTRENSPVGRLDDERMGLTRAISMSQPMGSLYEVTRLRNLRLHQQSEPDTDRSSEGPVDDFISRGVVSEAEAERLYQIFHTSLNHYLWVGLEQIHDSLDSVRRSSSLLTATILTVAALHVPSSDETFDKCYNVFLDLISASMFARKHNVDDVRGLCIGAFWLSDVAWKLSGHAIRIATELGIHQSFHHALKGDREHFLRARLWYMLYVCDKHFSIAYGRPPMISESIQIREYEQFLSSGMADILDFRLISQVALFLIINRVYDTLVQPSILAEESTALLPEHLLRQMRGFNEEIDQWRQYWTTRVEASPFIGQFPVIGITLYSYFGKLLLNSLALRGVNISQDQLSAERREYANMAINAAASIVSYVLEQPDLRRAMVGTPLYVHTMITWASVFLMKIATKWKSAGFSTEPSWIWTLLENMIQLMQSTMTSDRHVLHYIADGLQKMLVKSRQAVLAGGGLHQQHQQQHDFVAHPSIKQDSNASPAQQLGIAPGMTYNNGHSQANGTNGLLSPVHMNGFGQLINGVSAAAAATTPWSHSFPTCGAQMAQDPAAFDQMILNDGMIDEAFGGHAGSYNVYDLLQTQFPSY